MPSIPESSCRSLQGCCANSREKLAAKLRDGGLELDASPSSWKLKIRAKPVRNVAGSLAFIFMWAKLEQLPVAGLVKYSGNKRGYETGLGISAVNSQLQLTLPYRSDVWGWIRRPPPADWALFNRPSGNSTTSSYLLTLRNRVCRRVHRVGCTG